MKITASIATSKTDDALRKKEMSRGKNARGQGLPQSACPWSGGVAKSWWLEGWMQEDEIRKSTGE